MLVSELDVAALDTSLRFYADVLEFRILFERPPERFVYLERDGVELMIQEAAGPGRRFRTAPLEFPCGRGVSFQLRVDDVDAMHARAVEAGVDIVAPIEERWYRVDVAESGGRWQAKGPTVAGNRQFVLADPDGYLWRPFRDLGTRPAAH
jgi:catechol 2,3-dioxygenase-like lactoylglutathione lyase family enzyme